MVENSAGGVCQTRSGPFYGAFPGPQTKQGQEFPHRFSALHGGPRGFDRPVAGPTRSRQRTDPGNCSGRYVVGGGDPLKLPRRYRLDRNAVLVLHGDER